MRYGKLPPDGWHGRGGPTRGPSVNAPHARWRPAKGGRGAAVQGAYERPGWLCASQRTGCAKLDRARALPKIRGCMLAAGGMLAGVPLACVFIAAGSAHAAARRSRSIPEREPRVAQQRKENTVDPKQFADPGKEYRPSPFWSWNDALKPSELQWQVREFARQGFGGYFMHSRVGLDTPYLSKEWMDCIRACLEEGKRVGTESWLYDEDKWPSGFAGGLVTANNDEFRARFARMEALDPAALASALADADTIAVYRVASAGDGSLHSFSRVASPTVSLAENERLVAFKLHLAAKSNWYNGETYADLLNPAAVERFLQLTHDAYAKEFGGEFGEWMPGIFTDEPNYIGGDSGRAIPWTAGLPDYFRSLYGYDLLEKLPLLYFDGPDASAVRYDFWRAATLRFVEAFTKPYAQRCDKLGLKMTGHYLAEDNLESQIHVIGAAMPHYEWMQTPGIDHLGRNINDPLTLKQCSSVAHQFGRPRVLCEIFGVSGHSMTFEDQKWIADFHFALGITFLCQHLTLYTMKGEQKRDYPPTISYHQTYWPHYKLANDYFARAGYLCSQGRFSADILFLHPIGSAWAAYVPRFDGGGQNRVGEVNAALLALQDDLLAIHRDFDYGDETILANHASVDAGQIRVAKEGLYKVVVVPPSTTWARSTVDLIQRFLDAGGKLLFVGKTPTLIDGRPADAEWSAILGRPGVSHCDVSRDAIKAALDSILPRQISIADASGAEIGDIFVHHRVVGGKHIYFLSSKSRLATYEATITLPVTGRVTEWNLATGEVSDVPSSQSNGHTVIHAVFPPVGSHAFVVDTAAAPASAASRKLLTSGLIGLNGPFEFERLHPNSFTIDYCTYSINGGEWVGPVPIWKARRAAWNAAGLGQYAGIQPWALKAKGIRPTTKVTLGMRATFQSDVEGKKVYLVLESADRYQLMVNGASVSTNTDEWHWDKQFAKIDISRRVKAGQNLIELLCDYGMDVQVEDMYLVGDFGVKRLGPTSFTLTDEPSTLSMGSWGDQGYPMYAGTMRYHATFQVQKPEDGRVVVRLNGARGSLYLVSVNDGPQVPVCWQPWEADVTDQVRPGENRLTVDVVSTLRNTFGPLHHKRGDDLGWVGPGEFVDERNWVDEYQLIPYGLINGVQIVTMEPSK